MYYTPCYLHTSSDPLSPNTSSTLTLFPLLYSSINNTFHTTFLIHKNKVCIYILIISIPLSKKDQLINVKGSRPYTLGIAEDSNH